MNENSTFFDELMKNWQQHLNAQQTEATKNAAATFLKMQEELLKSYAAAGTPHSGTSGEFHSHDIYDAVVKLTNRINELESRLSELEKNK